MNDFIDETVKTRMTSIINDSGYVSSNTKNGNQVNDTVLQAYNIIKKILSESVSDELISSKKTERYLAILYNGNTRKWVARIVNRDTQIILIIPNEDKEEIKYRLDDVNDIKEYAQELHNVITMYTTPSIKDSNKEYVYTKWGKYEKPDPYKVYIKRGIPDNASCNG
jgi:hypothetical protein